MDRYNSLSDEDIVQKIQNGDDDLIGEIITRYEEKMQRYSKKFLLGSDTPDVIQEIFIKVYRNIQSFDTKRKFSSWIYRIAHNELINAIKKRRRDPLPFFDGDTIFPHPVAKENTESEMEKKELKQLINRSLNKLSPKYREPVILYYFEDLSYKEIADTLHIPTSTVGVRLKRAKEIIRKNYDQH